MEYKMKNINFNNELRLLTDALLRVQKQIGTVKQNADNPFFGSKYANLQTCWNYVRPFYNEENILIQQVVHETDSGVSIETLFIGYGTQLSGGKLPVPASKNDPQAYGSAVSYAKRYSLLQACGLATSKEDDDAEKTVVTLQFVDVEGKVLIEERDPTKYIKELGKYLPADNPDTDAQNLYEVNAKAIQEAKQLTKVVKFQEAYDRLIEVYEQA
jgi:hypothetical protein